ncbi:MAG: hypothetical protein LH614_22855 [Pyrinomonadaceae bacterium]|nr:hypothetical protein [Pyrinomonadaceae bacterium]
MSKIKTHRIFTFCVALFALFVSADIARACSCVVSPTVDIAFEKTPNVVVLKLQSVETLAEGEKGYGYGGIKQSKLTVEKVFKGNLKTGQELTFKQGGGGDCIWTFGEKGIGTEYLFYLGAKPVKDNIWAAFTCSRSASLEYVAADLLYLEKTAKLRGKTRISGTLTQSIAAAVEDEESSHNRLGTRKIHISGNGKSIELKTDDNGVYEIYDLPAGKYKITPEKNPGYKFSRAKNTDSVEVEIKAKGHTEQNFYFEIDNAIRGRLFDMYGKPLEDVRLELLPTRGKESQNFYQSDRTSKNGAFEFTEIPAGTYLIVVNQDGKISASEPFGTFYYPSATRREDAAPITVGAGDFREDLIVNAPQTAEIITISGVVLFEDGKLANKENAEDISIEFTAEKDGKQSKDDEDENDSQTQIDDKGRFSIRILKGQKGRLFGSLVTYAEEHENCPKLEKLISASKDSFPSIETLSINIEANNDLSGVELKFPFPSCKKAKI